jgi:hypothetical protein
MQDNTITGILLILKLEKGNPNSIKKKPKNLIKFSGSVKIAPKIPGINNKRIIIFLLKYKNKSLLRIIFTAKKVVNTTINDFAKNNGKTEANINSIITRVSSELFFIIIAIYISKK